MRLVSEEHYDFDARSSTSTVSVSSQMTKGYPVGSASTVRRTTGRRPPNIVGDQAVRESSKERRVPSGPDETYDTTRDLLTWMAKQFVRFGDIYKASIYGSTVYVTRDPRHAQHVLRENWRNYNKGLLFKRVALLLGSGLVSSEGKLWKTQRQMIQPAFHEKVILRLVQLIVAANRALLQRWQIAATDHRCINVTRDVSSAVLEVILRSIFGPDYDQVASPFSVLSDDTTRDLRFAQAFRSLEKILARLAAERRRANKRSNYILDILLEARDVVTGRPMSDRQLLNEIKTLIIAGHETTASTLNWTWYLLSRHSEVDARLHDEVSRLPSDQLTKPIDPTKYSFVNQVIEETLRMFPPVWLITRRALGDDQLGDYWVPAGTEVYIPPYFVQRHPDVWEDPDRFNPDRFGPDQSKERHPLAMLAFSAGPRNCVGEGLARIEMQIHITTIAKHLRLRLAQNQWPEIDAAVNLRSKRDFVMIPEHRAPILR